MVPVRPFYLLIFYTRFLGIALESKSISTLTATAQ